MSLKRWSLGTCIHLQSTRTRFRFDCSQVGSSKLGILGARVRKQRRSRKEGRSGRSGNHDELLLPKFSKLLKEPKENKIIRSKQGRTEFSQILSELHYPIKWENKYQKGCIDIHAHANHTYTNECISVYVREERITQLTKWYLKHLLMICPSY